MKKQWFLLWIRARHSRQPGLCETSITNILDDILVFFLIINYNTPPSCFTTVFPFFWEIFISQYTFRY